MKEATAGRGKGRPWVCPACGGEVLPEGATERDPVRCKACGARYRHPRMALLLSLALPGLGSIRQRHSIWGFAMMGFGTAAFVWTLWRILYHMWTVFQTDVPDVVGLLAEAGIGTGLVVLAYVADLLAVWLRRESLVPLD